MERTSIVRPGGDMQHAAKGITRRRVLQTVVVGSAAAAGSLALPYVITPAKSAPKSIKVGVWAGPDGQLIKSTIIKRFEKEHGIKVFVDEGWTTQQLARLRAGKNNPTHTVMFMDDIGVNLARREGLIDPLPVDKIPNLDKVSPRYVVEDGHGVGIQVSTVALTYSTQRQQDPPTSWAAFWDAKNRGMVSVPSITGTHGLNLVVISAALETGKPFQEAQYETEAAFKRLAKLKPNLHSVWSKTALAVAALQQGDLTMLGPMYSKFIWPYIDRGLQAKHIIPQEGAFAGVNCQTLVKGGPSPELGAAFINEILAAETQQMLGEKLSVAPVVQGLDLPSQVLERVAYGPDKQDKLFTSDWEFINRNRPLWTELWNKIFA